jgi:hypothetical protein
MEEIISCSSSPIHPDRAFDNHYNHIWLIVLFLHSFIQPQFQWFFIQIIQIAIFSHLIWFDLISSHFISIHFISIKIISGNLEWRNSESSSAQTVMNQDSNNHIDLMMSINLRLWFSILESKYFEISFVLDISYCHEQRRVFRMKIDKSFRVLWLVRNDLIWSDAKWCEMEWNEMITIVNLNSNHE